VGWAGYVVCIREVRNPKGRNIFGD